MDEQRLLEEFEALRLENTELRKKIDILVEQLSHCLEDYETGIMTATKSEKNLNRIQLQNAALLRKNKELQEKIDIIDNNKLGRMGIKVYQIYKRYFKK